MYGTVDGLKLRLNVTGAGSDALLEEQLNGASAILDRLLGRRQPQGVITRYYDSATILGRDDDTELFLDGYLLSDESLSVTNGDAVLVDPGDYQLLPHAETRKQSVLLTQASSLDWVWGDDEDGLIAVAGTWVVSESVVEAAYLIAVAINRNGQKDAQTVEQAVGQARSMVAIEIRMIGL